MPSQYDMSRPYSYVSADGKVVEFLDEHSLNTCLIGSLLLVDSLNVLVNRVCHLYKQYYPEAKDMQMLVEIIPVCLVLAQSLHDIGKAGKFYQKECLEVVSGGKQRQVYFTGHEIFSSAILYRILEKLDEYIWEKNVDIKPLASLFSIAVLQHHHALRTIRELIFEKAVYLLQRNWSVWKPACDSEHVVKIVRECVSQVQDLLGRIYVSFDRSQVEVDLRELCSRVGIYGAIRDVLDSIREEGLRVKLCLNDIESKILRYVVSLSRLLPAVTGLIVLPDRVAAKIKREAQGGTREDKIPRLEREFLRVVYGLDKYKQYIGKLPETVKSRLVELCRLAKVEE